VRRESREETVTSAFFPQRTKTWLISLQTGASGKIFSTRINVIELRGPRYASAKSGDIPPDVADHPKARMEAP